MYADSIDGTPSYKDDGIYYYDYNGINLNRRSGPAVIKNNGDKYWFKNGKLHREDGPATEFSNGTKYWYLNGKQHRTDGPAVILKNGYREWWIDGQRIVQHTNSRLDDII